MKTKIVYVLVSDGKDSFCEMTLLSIYSLRLHHPSVSIIIIMDAPTDVILRERYAEYLDGINLVILPVPELYGKKTRSRYFKTTLRQNIQGDFLYLDSDTLICASLQDIDSFSCDLACVLDYHSLRTLDQDDIIEKCRKIGFNSVAGHPYFNGGVFYVKDTLNSHNFFHNWHECWLFSVAHGYDIDQPALCQANINSGHPIQELAGEWNCQTHTETGKKLLSKAKVLHYYTMFRLYSPVKERLFNDIKATKGISASADKVARNPRTLGFAVFTSEMAFDKPMNEFVYSDLLFPYCSIRPLYNTLCFLARILSNPVLRLIRLKTNFLLFVRRLEK